MTSQSFNLIDEPWIRAQFMDATESDVSIRDAFVNARRISRLDGEVPTQVFAIHGLLTAIMRCAFDGPRGRDTLPYGDDRIRDFESTGLLDWRRWFDQPELAVQAILQYLDEFHDRFDLRDPAVPFFQVADLHTSKDEYSDLSVLLADVPNGEPFFTTRIREGNARISWAEAARWLVHVHAFDPSGIRTGAVGDPRVKGGKGYPQGPGWSAQIGGLIVERPTLWETLMINLVPTGYGDLNFSPDEDLPPWERPQLTEKEEVPGGREPRGPVDLATWQSRRVRLIGDDDGVVGVVLCQGDPVKPQNRVPLEPRTAWRYSDPQTKKFKETVYMPREHDPSRALWRGLESLLPGVSTNQGNMPGAVPRFRTPSLSSWLEDLIDAEVLQPSDAINYHAIGVKLGSQSAVITELINDSVELPGYLFAPHMDSLRTMVVHAAQLSDDLVRNFGYFAANLAKSAGADLTEGEESKAKEQLLSAIAPEFTRWVREVMPESIEEDARRWRFTLYEISEAEAHTLLSTVPISAYPGRMTNRGEMAPALAKIYFDVARRKLGIVSRIEAERGEDRHE